MTRYAVQANSNATAAKLLPELRYERYNINPSIMRVALLQVQADIGCDQGLQAGESCSHTNTLQSKEVQAKLAAAPRQTMY